MKASVVDLRYKMKNILQALDRNEPVTITYHGREKAIITSLDNTERKSVIDHPFFGMKTESIEPVDETMKRLRGGRY
jgi:prevent-host-death family protein